MNVFHLSKRHVIVVDGVADYTSNVWISCESCNTRLIIPAAAALISDVDMECPQCKKSIYINPSPAR